MVEKACGTSPGKVYAKRERTADFLLGVGSVQLNSELSEIGLELFGRLEDDSRHPEALSGFRVGGNIVNINGFLGTDLAGLEGFAVDDWVRLARANAIGIDANGKEAEKGEASLFIGHVAGIGIRSQCHAVILR